MKYTLVILLSIIMCSYMYSQDSTNAKYALSFGIGNNFTLNNFDMDIAVKKIINEEHQLRLFLSPNLSTRNQDNETSNSSVNSDSKTITYGFY